MPALGGLLGGSIPHSRRPSYSSRRVTLVPLNATLGVEGLPQSGTGQTALLTGENAPKIAGRHFGPYPATALKPVIAEKNIFRQLATRGKRSMYANAFPRQYFEHLASRRPHATPAALAWIGSGSPLNDAARLAAGEAVSTDITNEGWGELGYPGMPVIRPQEAGRRLASLAGKFDFVLFEYFYTDHAGHSRSMEKAARALGLVDGLLEGILSAADLESTLLVITSDHGNLEDLSTKSHTRNPVPLLLAGRGHASIGSRCRDLTHVAPSLLHMTG